jgi:glutaconate CoA-transferase, subunit B
LRLSRRILLQSINPGYSIKDVQDNCGFELLKAPKITETAPPTEIELKILREEVDPHRYVIER